MGMGLSNGPSSSAATACVPAEQVGEASGVSNMARYVGAAVATALAATIYGTVTANQQADGASSADALASGLAAASWVMVVFSALGILLALVAIRRFRAEKGTLQDAAASASAHLHTLPTTAVRAPSAVTSGQDPSGGVSTG
jgi:sugar phosphate permease